MAAHLLSRLGLSRQADNVCGAYSGGNKRKLSVAVSMVGRWVVGGTARVFFLQTPVSYCVILLLEVSGDVF